MSKWIVPRTVVHSNRAWWGRTENPDLELTHHYIKSEMQSPYKLIVRTYCGKSIWYHTGYGRWQPGGHRACYTINPLEAREKPGHVLCETCKNDPEAALAALAQTEL